MHKSRMVGECEDEVLHIREYKEIQKTATSEEEVIGKW